LISATTWRTKMKRLAESLLLLRVNNGFCPNLIWVPSAKSTNIHATLPNKVDSNGD
jgi:hypothetical protein